jgi:hypothetical protein
MKGRPHSRKELELQRDSLIGELHGLGNLMRGRLARVRVKCGRKGCECEDGFKHEKVHLLLNFRGRTRTRYVGREREGEVGALLSEYQRAWQIIEGLTEVNLELLRGTHPGGRQRRKKP